MALSVTPEDGTGLANASSYATLQTIIDYSAQRGIALPTDPDELVPLVTQALDFLESYETRYQGQRTYAAQALAWPRNGVNIRGNYQPNNVVPLIIVNAHCYLVGIALTVDLSAVQDTRAILEDKIGPLDTKYSATAGATVRPMIPLLDSMLAPVLRAGVGTLRAIRI